jgi:uncharacterized protein GlcG (DUF336 family)
MNLGTARTIIAAARTTGVDSGFKPLTVVVLDAGGHVVGAEREDGSSIGRFDIAYGKAHGALSLGIGSRAIMARAEQQPYFVAAATRGGRRQAGAGPRRPTRARRIRAAIVGIESTGLIADTG